MTFGKYKGNDINDVIADKSYCIFLVNEVIAKLDPSKTNKSRVDLLESISNKIYMKYGDLSNQTKSGKYVEKPVPLSSDDQLHNTIVQKMFALRQERPEVFKTVRKWFLDME